MTGKTKRASVREIASRCDVSDAAVSNGLNVSLICFNNKPFCNWVIPLLTTAGIPSAKIGQVAAEILLRKMESPPKSASVCIKLAQELIIYLSTAKPLD